MSIRVSTSSLITGAIVCGNRGLGVLGSAVPSTGDNGAGYIYNDLSLPADAGKEYRGLITVPPSGTLFAYEDSSFTYTGSASTFTYRLFEDGVDKGTAVATLGATVHTLTGANGTQSNVGSTGDIGGAGEITLSGAAGSQANTGSTGAISQMQTLLGNSATQINIGTAGAISQMQTLLGNSATQINIGTAGAISIPGFAVYPSPSNVLLGVTYGPTGADYTGTATGVCPSAADIAIAVWNHTQ